MDRPTSDRAIQDVCRINQSWSENAIMTGCDCQASAALLYACNIKVYQCSSWLNSDICIPSRQARFGDVSLCEPAAQWVANVKSAPGCQLAFPRGQLALAGSIAIMTTWAVIPGTDMRSIPGQKSPLETRRAWEAPAIAELPIGRGTKAAFPRDRAFGNASPPAPASPSTKLGFAFEMSFPLSARTE